MKIRKFHFGLVVLAIGLAAGRGVTTEPRPVQPKQFNQFHQMIKPQPGENRFWDIPWHLSIWEARKQAAAEGKPIFIWSGSQGAPIAGC